MSRRHSRDYDPPSDDEEMHISRPPSSVSSYYGQQMDVLDPSTMPVGSRSASPEFPGVPERGALDASYSILDELTLYIDQIAVAIGLNETYHTKLHVFGQLAGNLPDVQSARVAIFQEATILQTQQMIVDNKIELDAFTKILEDVKVTLSQRLELTPYQRGEIRITCHNMVFEADRTDFDIVEEAWDELKKNKETNGLESIFASRARTKDLKTEVSRQASYSRNVLRKHIRDSLFGAKNRCGLTLCTVKAGKKFLPGGSSVKIGPQHTIHMAILRRFARDNSELLEREEKLENDNSEMPEDTGAGEKQRTTKEKEEKKKKGRVADGLDFWSQVRTFFQEKDDLWGTDVRVGGWAQYIDECIAQEKAMFPEDRIAALPSAGPRTTNLAATSSTTVVSQEAALLTQAFAAPASQRSSGPLPGVRRMSSHFRGGDTAASGSQSGHDSIRPHTLPPLNMHMPMLSHPPAVTNHGTTSNDRRIRSANISHLLGPSN